MKEQLRQYVELLFAGAPDSEEIKQEILQNTLDRYDDLIAQGKVPEAAYRLAITGIGDINEILGSGQSAPPYQDQPAKEQQEDPQRKKDRAFAIGMYIASPIPLFILSELGVATLGLCMTLLLVAAATVLIIRSRNPAADAEPHPAQQEPSSPRQELRKSIKSLIGIVTLVIYLVVSFVTGAWYITWLIFPLSGAVQGLVKAILDLKEAVEYEN